MNQKEIVNAKIADYSREFIVGFNNPNELDHLGFKDLEQIEELKQAIVTLLYSIFEGSVDMDINNRMMFSLDINSMKTRMT